MTPDFAHVHMIDPLPFSWAFSNFKYHKLGKRDNLNATFMHGLSCCHLLHGSIQKDIKHTSKKSCEGHLPELKCYTVTQKADICKQAITDLQ